MSIIKTEHLSRFYQQGPVQIHALMDVNLVIEKGDFAVLAGPSGSGKTTLLNMIGALDKPSEGKSGSMDTKSRACRAGRHRDSGETGSVLSSSSTI